MIYSFDGGTEVTYEKMRPGRFKKNKFKDVLNNISNFNKIRKNLNSRFPRTKIQMIVTNETRNEIEEFKNTFIPIVDDVSLKSYTERGGNIEDLDEISKNKIKSKFPEISNDENFYI